MIINRPHYGLIGAVALLLMAGAVARYLGPGIIEYGLAGMLTLLAGVCTLDWWFRERALEAEALILAEQEDLEITRLLAMMPPDVLASLQESRIVREHVIGWGEVREEWVFPASMNDSHPLRCSVEDITAVWGACTPEGFAPVSSWGDGTKRRQCALAMVNRFSQKGWLRPAAGNQRAQWVGNGYEQARLAIWGTDAH